MAEGQLAVEADVGVSAVGGHRVGRVHQRGDAVLVTVQRAGLDADDERDLVALVGDGGGPVALLQRGGVGDGLQGGAAGGDVLEGVGDRLVVAVRVVGGAAAVPRLDVPTGEHRTLGRVVGHRDGGGVPVGVGDGHLLGEGRPVRTELQPGQVGVQHAVLVDGRELDRRCVIDHRLQGRVHAGDGDERVTADDLVCPGGEDLDGGRCLRGRDRGQARREQCGQRERGRNGQRRSTECSHEIGPQGGEMDGRQEVGAISTSTWVPRTPPRFLPLIGGGSRR